MLENLAHILAKAQAHVDAGKGDAQALLASRLIAGMYSLAKRVQIACDKVRNVVARLAGLEVPYYEDHEQSLAELQERIARSIEFFRSMPAERGNGTEDAEIALPVTGGEVRYRGLQLLFGHSLPSVYSHSMTACNLLRQNGVVIGKRDFFGNP